MEPEGKKSFYCPHCQAKLSFFNGEFIRLLGELDSEFFTVRTVIYIPSALGKYGAIFQEGIKLKEGANVEFFCPDCNANLSTPFNPQLAALKMRDEKGAEFYVFFSKIYGEKATYVVDYSSKHIAERFGADAANIDATQIEKNINYFGA